MYWTDFALLDSQARAGTVLLVGAYPVRDEASCFRQKLHPFPLAVSFPATLFRLIVSTITYYWVKGRIDDNRLEFTRPENRKSRILTCTSIALRVRCQA